MPQVSLCRAIKPLHQQKLRGQHRPQKHPSDSRLLSCNFWVISLALLVLPPRGTPYISHLPPDSPLVFRFLLHLAASRTLYSSFPSSKGRPPIP